MLSLGGLRQSLQSWGLTLRMETRKSQRSKCLLPQSCSGEHSQVAATLSNIPAFSRDTSSSGIPSPLLSPTFRAWVLLPSGDLFEHPRPAPSLFSLLCPLNQLYYPLICYLVLACGTSRDHLQHLALCFGCHICSINVCNCNVFG